MNLHKYFYDIKSVHSSEMRSIKIKIFQYSTTFNFLLFMIRFNKKSFVFDIKNYSKFCKNRIWNYFFSWKVIISSSSNDLRLQTSFSYLLIHSLEILKSHVNPAKLITNIFFHLFTRISNRGLSVNDITDHSKAYFFSVLICIIQKLLIKKSNESYNLKPKIEF